MTALLISSLHGYHAITHQLLCSGANVDIQSNLGNTALILCLRYAPKESRSQTLDLLLNAGADVNIKNLDNETPISIVWNSRHKSNKRNTRPKTWIRQIIAAGADVSRYQNDSLAPADFELIYDGIEALNQSKSHTTQLGTLLLQHTNFIPEICSMIVRFCCSRVG